MLNDAAVHGAPLMELMVGDDCASHVSVQQKYNGAVKLGMIPELQTGGGFGIGTVVAFVLVAAFLYLLFRPYKESNSLKVNTKSIA